MDAPRICLQMRSILVGLFFDDGWDLNGEKRTGDRICVIEQLFPEQKRVDDPSYGVQWYRDISYSSNSKK